MVSTRVRIEIQQFTNDSCILCVRCAHVPMRSIKQKCAVNVLYRKRISALQTTEMNSSTRNTARVMWKKTMRDIYEIRKKIYQAHMDHF